jgi:1-acyl-sn-glycerol-3-phosphate acyltransferase
MIKAKHHWFLYPFFEWYMWNRMKLHFSKIRIDGNFEDRGLPLLVIPNHFSWWDGFIISSLNRKVFHRKYHVMMLEKQLKKYLFFSKTGAFSISTDPKGILESMSYAAKLLKKSENMVTFFPQGHFESVYQYPLHLKGGLKWLLKNLKNEIQVIFVANLAEYFEYPKPQLFIYYKEYIFSEINNCIIEKDYNNFYIESINKNINRINY